MIFNILFGTFFFGKVMEFANKNIEALNLLGVAIGFESYQLHNLLPNKFTP